jgi:cysteinyl-tRNA synthetase
MALRVYNTLTAEKEPFTTVTPGKVGIYCCGPTVYMNSHIGHMVGPVIFDTIKRYLQYVGYEVTLVINITDVEDKLINQATKENTSVASLAERVTADYLANLRKLGVDGVDHMPKATDNIEGIIRITQGLIDRGYAYAAGGDVYFDVTRDADYGKLSHRDPDALQAGARIEPSPLKRSPGDFALWKAAKPSEPAWDSPWGRGRPGWHIECSAMSMRYLGETFDIHGGGLDLVFPHHENEIAQSESFTGKTFARYWLHNGLLQRTGEARKLGAAPREGDIKQQEAEKMSKSKGNIVTISELLSRHQPETVRFFLLSTHYRRPIDFSDERIDEVGRGLQAFYRFFERYERITGTNFYALNCASRAGEFAVADPHGEFVGEVKAQRDRYLEAMDDDFNTGGAVGVLFDLLRTLNAFADRIDLEGKGKSDASARATFVAGAAVLRELAAILGVFVAPVARPSAASPELTQKLTGVAGLLKDRWNIADAPAADADSLMTHFIALRKAARSAKNFKLADDIRKELTSAGVVLEDRADGTTWRVQ